MPKLVLPEMNYIVPTDREMGLEILKQVSAALTPPTIGDPIKQVAAAAVRGAARLIEREREPIVAPSSTKVLQWATYPESTEPNEIDPGAARPQTLTTLEDIVGTLAVLGILCGLQVRSAERVTAWVGDISAAMAATAPNIWGEPRPYFPIFHECRGPNAIAEATDWLARQARPVETPR